MCAPAEDTDFHNWSDSHIRLLDVTTRLKLQDLRKLSRAQLGTSSGKGCETVLRSLTKIRLVVPAGSPSEAQQCDMPPLTRNPRCTASAQKHIFNSPALLPDDHTMLDFPDCEPTCMLSEVLFCCPLMNGERRLGKRSVEELPTSMM